jgi:RNA polymerase sigma-70 factor, ECF subfamily
MDSQPRPEQHSGTRPHGDQPGGPYGRAVHAPLNFEEIHHAYRARVYSLCLRMVRNTTDAEDLTKEVFLQVFRKMDTFRGDSAFSTWLHRVAVNVVLMNTRKRRHYVEVPIEPEQDEETTRPTPELEVVDRNLSSATDRIDLQRAIAELPPSCKTTLVLYELCGYRHMEIAKLMGTSYSNSKSQLRRARIRMRRLLSQNRPLRVRKARTAFQLAAAEANSDAPNSIHSFALQKLAVGTEPPDTMKENSAADPA